MKKLSFKNYSLIKILTVSVVLMFSGSVLAHSGSSLGSLWKTLTQNPTGSYNCENNKKLIGLANESPNPVELYFFFYDKKGKGKKVASSREMDVGQRGNVNLKSGEIVLVCTNYSVLGVSTRLNKEKDESQFKKDCQKSKKSKCSITLNKNNFVYTFKKTVRVVGKGDFKSHGEPATREQLFKFGRYLKIIKSRS